MPQSLTSIIIHIVFSTKNRENILQPEITPKLYDFIAKCLQNRGCEVFKIGGIANHVHILCLMSKKYTVEKLLKKLKSAARNGLKPKGINLSISIGNAATEFFLLAHKIEKL